MRWCNIAGSWRVRIALISVERYAMRTGRDLSDIGYYVAFSCWRLAIISEGVYARYRAGAMGDQAIDTSPMTSAVEGLADRALEAMRSLA